MKTKVIDRETGRFFDEKIFGESFVRWAHQTSLGKFTTSNVLIQKLASKTYGAYASSGFSKKEIPKFILDHKINMADFIVPDGGYKNFNEFFSRNLTDNARIFPIDDSQMGSPAEGRVFYSKIRNSNARLSVKAREYSIEEFVGESLDESFSNGGHVFVIRLCPVDYHRYHFSLDGKVIELKKLGNKLFSVNPMALKIRDRLFWENERSVSTLEIQRTKHKLFQAEVGAICVGKMSQNKEKGESFKRGEEKGTFLFGGSTVVLILPNSFSPAQDLVKNSSEGFETLVKLGDVLANF